MLCRPRGILVAGNDGAHARQSSTRHIDLNIGFILRLLGRWPKMLASRVAFLVLLLFMSPFCRNVEGSESCQGKHQYGDACFKLLQEGGPNIEVAGVDAGYPDDGYDDHDETKTKERSYADLLAEADFHLP